jgi:glycerol-3-phosphate dehydrogenase (NAD(P)+)
MARAVARILALARVETRVWSRDPARVEALAKELPSLHRAQSLAEATEGAETIFLAVPASALLSVAEQYGESAKGDHVVIHAVRGVGAGFLLPHQMIRAKTCVRKIGVLGGPLQSPELDGKRPLAAVLASRFAETIHALQSLTANTPVIIHGSRDVIGVEIAGAISNVAAIAAGMSDALELGETARGLLLTRGLAEARKLGAAFGADPATFAGLAGVGDLIPRPVSSTDRHRQLGGKLAKGTGLATALEAIAGEVEGIVTAHEAVRVAAKLGLDLPLMRAVENVLDERVAAKTALDELLRMAPDLETRSSREAHA